MTTPTRHERVTVELRELEAKLKDWIASYPREPGQRIPIGALQNVLREVWNMQEAMSPALFSPGSGRFLADYQLDDDSQLQEILRVQQSYRRLKTPPKPRIGT